MEHSQTGREKSEIGFLFIDFRDDSNNEIGGINSACKIEMLTVVSHVKLQKQN